MTVCQMTYNSLLYFELMQSNCNQQPSSTQWLHHTILNYGQQ